MWKMTEEELLARRARKQTKTSLLLMSLRGQGLQKAAGNVNAATKKSEEARESSNLQLWTKKSIWRNN